MKKSVLVLIISFLSISAWAKKNVCAITINSNHEINLFKKSLSKKQWNFIELTDYADKDNDDNDLNSWFLNSCKAKVSCDILVISGHFGGTFFGESAFSLPLEELEKNTCNRSCDGIINQPKEVFLFGCNTLAGKEKDQRSPEQYFQVLINDGFSRQQAEQVVAFRYSALGHSFSTRMSQVFENTPRIYGFSSIGPSGKTVEPLLSKYLRSAKSEYQNFDKHNQTLKTKMNTKIFTALKNSAIAQTAGLKTINPELKNTERPYCYLENNEISRYNKLKYVTEVLLSGRSLTMIPYIKDFIHNLIKKNDITTEERLLLQQISSSHQVKSDFNKILDLNGDVYLGTKVNIMNLMTDLSLKTKSDYTNYFLKIIDFSHPITQEKKDRICSLDIHLDFEPEQVSEENKKNSLFYNLTSCLKPTNESIHMMIAQAMRSDESLDVRSSAAQALDQIKVTNESILSTIVETIRFDKSLIVRNYALLALRNFNLVTEPIQMMFVETMKSNKDHSLRRSAAQALGQIKVTNESIQMMIAETMKNDKISDVRSSAAQALGQIKVTNESIQMMIAETMKNDKISEVRSSAAYALGEIKITNETIQMMIAETLKSDEDEFVRFHSANALGQIKITNKSIKMMITESIRNDESIYVRNATSKALKQINEGSPQ